MKSYAGSAWREIVSGKAFFNNSWRTLTIGKVFKGGAWQQIFSFVPPLSVAVSPTSFSASSRGSNIASKSLTATPTGGLAPFTYAWTVTSTTAPVTLSGASTANVTVSGDVSVVDTITVSLSCTVTDSLGTTASGSASGTLYYGPGTGGTA